MAAATIPQDEYLSTDQVETIHGLLQDQLEDLISAARAPANELQINDQGNQDEADLAHSFSSRDLSLRVAGRERKLLLKVRQQLTRIQEGELGACSECGGEIAYARLLARPVATRCIDCQTSVDTVRDGWRRPL